MQEDEGPQVQAEPPRQISGIQRLSSFPQAIRSFLRLDISQKGGRSEKPRKLDELLDIDPEVVFNERWAGPILLGPLPIFIAAIVVVITATYTVDSNKGSCGYPLESFLRGVVALSYLFLAIYSWIFIGDPIEIRGFLLFTPFTSLASVVIWYTLIGLASLVCFGIGTLYIVHSQFCAVTAPTLYYYSYTVIILYWIIVFITFFNICKISCNLSIVRLMGKFHDPTIQEMEADFFDAKFNLFIDKQKSTLEIPTSSFPQLLYELQIEATEDDIHQFTKLLDSNGIITKEVLYEWYRHRMEADRIKNPVNMNISVKVK